MKGTYYEQPFLSHFLDAIGLCDMAEALPHISRSRHSALARGAVMACSFSLEAAANILMGPIEAPRNLVKLVDQAKILDKFEFILFGIQPSKKLDRGVAYIQSVVELFEIRNSFVHPRTRKREITRRELGKGVVTIEKKDAKSNLLGLPASPEDWGVDDARRVLKATSDFLDYFVLDLCELENNLARRILLSTVEFEDSANLVLRDDEKDLLRRAACRWSIDFRLAELLLGEPPAAEAPNQKLLFVFSWGLGGFQVHENKRLIEVEGETVTTVVVMAAVQQFMLWFAEAEYRTYGRHLLVFEI